MKVATIDFDCSLPGVQRFSLQSPGADAGSVPAAGPAVFDAVDLAVWNAAPLLAGPFERIEPGGRGVLSPGDSQTRLARSRALRDALRRLLRRAGTLAVLLPAPGAVGVHTLQEVVDFEPLETLPEPPPRLVPLPAAPEVAAAAPARMDAGTAAPAHPDATAAAPAGWRGTAGEPFARFFRDAGTLLAPSAAIAAGAGRPIATLDRRPDVVVAGYRYAQPGRLLWLPAARDRLAPAAADALVAAILALARRLAAADFTARPPDWWLAAPPADEAALAGRIAALSRTLVDTRDALEQTTRDFADLQRIGALAWGDREAVARALVAAIDRFGGYVQPIGADGEVVVERDGRVGVFVIIGAEPAAAAIAAARSAAARIGADLGVPVRPILLPTGEHDRAPAERSGSDAVSQAQAERAGVAFADGAALLRAWRAGDATLLAALLEPASG
ncbi:MAG: hypothetical protein AB7G13_17840 [Lautropia sp.]